ncbi:MAG: dinB 2 [Gammaproteobacteria bacterium]|jgi:DNA polymerase-4|nr:dinB 2 [Gammaproteobacteria bacterium]
MTIINSDHWQRAIILVDMNAFFAAIEQLDFNELRHKPIAVTNGEQGSCIITCSYEARAYGIKTGMRFFEARKLCPELIRRPSRHKRYAEVSRTIMQALRDITPDIEIYSVDEAFLDITHCQKLYGSPIKIAELVKEKVWQVAKLPCSIGLSGDKSTAKFAANLHKPNGLTIIPPWEAKERLRRVPVSELWGVGKGITEFLARYRVVYCGDMEKLPISVLAQRFGNLGRRLWNICQGADPDPVRPTLAEPKSMGHGKVLPPNVTDEKMLLIYFRHMCEKLAARLRRNRLAAQEFFIGAKSYQWGWLGGKYKTAYPCNDGAELYALCRKMLREHWQGAAVFQVQVTAYDPRPEGQQLELFLPDEESHNAHQVIDTINQRYGEFTIAPASLLNRSKMPNVISPAWKPEGPKQSV